MFVTEEVEREGGSFGVSFLQLKSRIDATASTINTELVREFLMRLVYPFNLFDHSSGYVPLSNSQFLYTFKLLIFKCLLANWET